MRSVGILIFPAFQLLDAAGPVAAFEVAGHGLDSPPYRLTLLARHAGVVRSSSGAALFAQGFDTAERLDTLIVSGGSGT